MECKSLIHQVLREVVGELAERGMLTQNWDFEDFRDRETILQSMEISARSMHLSKVGVAS